ncbi:hypothetical protein E2C01_036793 [Portunus trituberculatus]|uniref:Uncharacterized protein n=1 Tax=Portunus trituberculatus TaxID=210409 RepID=A0A5B7FCB6_PORTR|nr:hypothetical protein [Portunus trituberculatus]
MAEGEKTSCCESLRPSYQPCPTRQPAPTVFSLTLTLTPSRFLPIVCLHSPTPRSIVVGRVVSPAVLSLVAIHYTLAFR